RNVTGVQTCALPIYRAASGGRGRDFESRSHPAEATKRRGSWTAQGGSGGIPSAACKSCVFRGSRVQRERDCILCRARDFQDGKTGRLLPRSGGGRDRDGDKTRGLGRKYHKYPLDAASQSAILRSCSTYLTFTNTSA